MATRLPLLPEAATYPASNYPQYGVDSTTRQSWLGFDASTEETCYWRSVIPQGWTGTVVAVVSYKMASATSGGVAFRVAVEAVTSGDALDLDASTSFDTGNVGTDTVPATAGYMKQVSITLTNLDNAAPADLVRFSLTREVGNASDTATGDAQVLAVEIRDGA